MFSHGSGSSEVEQLSSESNQAQYGSLKVGALLRQESNGSGEPWYWAINPYQGCEFACTFCQVRLPRKAHAAWRAFDRHIGVKANAAEVLMRELAEVGSEGLRGRQVVLGTTSDPWQPAEEHFRVTRALLEVLLAAQSGPRALELRVRADTRSSLIARDTDLLRQLPCATVVFSIASLDDRVNRLLEPRAPSAFRRLAALEALASSDPVIVEMPAEDL